jgi:TonB-dependent starch-binding outer membrane protein SusC
MITRMVYKILLVSLLTVFSLAAVAQNKTIQGKVTSVEDGKTAGLPGVNVIVMGTVKGTTTDADGNYRLELAQDENSLTFSFIGYKTQTIAVGSQSIINLVLQSDAQELEEVVVVGYGVQKKASITGATATVKGEELFRQPVLTAAANQVLPLKFGCEA